MNYKLLILIIIILVLFLIFYILKLQPRSLEHFRDTNYFSKAIKKTERSINNYFDQDILFFRNIGDINTQANLLFNAIMGQDVSYTSLVFPSQMNTWSEFKSFMSAGKIENDRDLWLENAYNINNRIIEIQRLSNEGRASIYGFYNPELGFKNPTFMRNYNNSNGWISQVSVTARIGAFVIEKILKERDWYLGVELMNQRNQNIEIGTRNFIKDYILSSYKNLNSMSIVAYPKGIKNIDLSQYNTFSLTLKSDNSINSEEYQTFFNSSETIMNIKDIEVTPKTRISQQNSLGITRIFLDKNQYRDFITDKNDLRFVNLDSLSDISNNRKINMEAILFRNIEFNLPTLADSCKTVYIICKASRNCLMKKKNNISVYDKDSYYVGIHKLSLIDKYFAAVKGNAPLNTSYVKNSNNNDQLYIRWQLIPTSINNCYRLYCTDSDDFLSYGNYYIPQESNNALRIDITYTRFEDQPKKVYTIKSNDFSQQIERSNNNERNILDQIKKETLWLIERDDSDYNTYTIKHYDTGYEQVYVPILSKQNLDSKKPVFSLVGNNSENVKKLIQPYTESLIYIEMRKTNQSNSDIMGLDNLATVGNNKFFIIPCEPKKEFITYQGLSSKGVFNKVSELSESLNSTNQDWFSPISIDQKKTLDYINLNLSPSININPNDSEETSKMKQGLKDINNLNIYDNYIMSSQGDVFIDASSTVNGVWFGAPKNQLRDWRLQTRNKEVCQRHAEKNNYAAWGFRNRFHPSRFWRNSCWFYKDFFNYNQPHYDRGIRHHEVHCTDRNNKINNGCRRSDRMNINILTQKGMASNKFVFLAGDISKSGVGYMKGLNNFVEIRQNVKGMPKIKKSKENIWSINVPGLNVVNNRPIGSARNVNFFQCKNICTSNKSCAGIDYDIERKNCNIYGSLDKGDLRFKANSILATIPSRNQRVTSLGSYGDSGRRRAPWYLGVSRNKEECFARWPDIFGIKGLQFPPAAGMSRSGRFNSAQCFGTLKDPFWEWWSKSLGPRPNQPFHTWGGSNREYGGAWANNLYKLNSPPNLPVLPSNTINFASSDNDIEDRSRPITIVTKVYDYNSIFLSNLSFFRQNWNNKPNKVRNDQITQWEIKNNFFSPLDRYEYDLEKKDILYLNINAFAQILENDENSPEYIKAAKIIRETDMNNNINSNVAYIFNPDTFGSKNFESSNDMGDNSLIAFNNLGNNYIGLGIKSTSNKYIEGIDFGMSPLRNYIWFKSEVNIDNLHLSYMPLSEFLSKYNSLVNTTDSNIQKKNRTTIIEDIEKYQFKALGYNFDNGNQNFNYIYDNKKFNYNVDKVYSLTD